jgi:hypothetical protein
VRSQREQYVATMIESLTIEFIEPASEDQSDGETRRREARRAQSCGVSATAPIEPDDFRAELACGGRETCPEPYDEGFGAYQSGGGLADNPYHADNCAHLQWANGWSQARDEAQRRARQFPR